MARASRAAPSLDRVRAATISDRLQASPSDTPTAAHQRPGGGPRARAVGARVPSAPSASRCRPGSGRRRRDAPSLRTRTAGGRRDPAPWRPPRRRGHHSTRQGVFPNRRSGTIASTFPHVQAAPHPCAASLSTGPWTRGPRHRSTGVLYAAASRAAARLPRTSHAESRNGDREANVPSGLRGVRPTHALAGGWLHPRGRCCSPPDTVHHSMGRRDGKRTQSQNQRLQPTQGSPGLRWAMRLPACFPVPSRTDRTRRPVIL